MAENNQLVTLRDKFQDSSIVAALQSSVPSTMQKYLTPDRVTRIVLGAVSRDKYLMQCTPASILRSVMDSVSLGLEPTGGVLGQAYMIAYRNNKQGGRYEAQLIVGYRGLISLARRSGGIQSVEAHIVYEKDHFDLEYGLDSKIKHKPSFEADRGKILGAYSVARFVEGGFHFEFMTKAEIDAIRERSRAANNGPWVTDYAEMAKKTVVRRASKFWPMSIDMAKALEIESRAEADEEQIDNNIVDASFANDDDEEKPPTKAQKLNEKLQEPKRAAKKAVTVQVEQQQPAPVAKTEPSPQLIRQPAAHIEQAEEPEQAQATLPGTLPGMAPTRMDVAKQLDKILEYACRKWSQPIVEEQLSLLGTTTEYLARKADIPTLQYYIDTYMAMKDEMPDVPWLPKELAAKLNNDVGMPLRQHFLDEWKELKSRVPRK
jgi:recombination protein RecT